jgi:micrococcal nuclease
VHATATVARVVDGDTVVLRMSGHRARVRLIGVDAPETWSRHDCFGTESTRVLRRLLPTGSPVLTARDTELRDRYGRLLLYLWTAKRPRGGHRRAPPNASAHAGVVRTGFVNADLIRTGSARAMTVPPNTRNAFVLHAAESTARRAHTGLWQACA